MLSKLKRLDFLFDPHPTPNCAESPAIAKYQHGNPQEVYTNHKGLFEMLIPPLSENLS
jgi:hypothetical protein